MATSPLGAGKPLHDSLQTAGAYDLIVIHQDQYNQWLRAKDAMDGLAWLLCEVANKALRHPEKDSFVNVPSESLAALVWCVHDNAVKDDSVTLGQVLHQRPELTSKGEQA